MAVFGLKPVARPADDAARLASEAARPADDAADAGAAVDAARPAGGAARLANEAARPADDAARPAGAAVRLASEAADAGAALCEAPRERDCTFYPACIEANVPCGPTGYAIGFGEKYCERFKAATFSPKGAAWADSVMVCLERSLAPYGRPDKKVASCDEITQAAFDSHPACYTKSPASICFLPPPDVLSVFDTIGADEIFAARTRAQIHAVIATCTVQVAESRTDPFIDAPDPDAGSPHGPGQGDGRGYGGGHGRLGGTRLGFWRELAYRYKVPGAKPPHPRVRLPGSTVSGGLPPEVVSRIVLQSYGRFHLCYDAALGGDPALAGTIGVTFTIEKDGTTSGVDHDATTTVTDKRLVACVKRAFPTMQFPAPKDGAKVSVSYPIVFDTGEAATRGANHEP
jgi:hypothetical protein